MTKTRPRGQCQCGNIQYELCGEPLTLYVCHCLHCQKQSSSAFGMSLWIRPVDFKLLCGELTFWTTQGDSGTKKICAFCNLCGSRIYHAMDDNEASISLKAGSLNDTSRLHPIAHIWTSRAQPWVSINEDLYRCYDKEPDDDDVLLSLWEESHPSSRKPTV